MREALSALPVSLRITSKLHRSSRDLKSKVGAELLNQLTHYSQSSLPAQTSSLPAQTSSLPAQTSSLPAQTERIQPYSLFRICKTAHERALVGATMIENNVDLPISLHKTFLRSLLEMRMKAEAIELYERNPPAKSEPDRTEWARFGIEIYCQSLRPTQAEELVSSDLRANPAVCTKFVSMYAKMRQSENARRWCEHIVKAVSLNAAKTTAERSLNFALKCLIYGELWEEVQLLLVEMNRLNVPVDSNLTAACFEAATTSPLSNSAFPQLAALLESDGSLVNVPRFRRSLDDPKAKIKDLLSANKLDNAVELIQGYKGQNFVSLAYIVLKYVISHPERLSVLAAVVPRVLKSPEDSMHIQFMLGYLQLSKRYDEIWPYLYNKRMSYENYCKFWQIVLSECKTGNFPKLRAFVTATTARTVLRPQLLRLMVLSLKTVPDIPAIAGLLKFADKECRVQLDGDWRTVAKSVADQHHTDLDGVEEAASDFANELRTASESFCESP